MTYGTIKVDTVTFTDAGIDKSVTLSGLVQNPTFSGNVTVTGTLSGVTVTGTTANFTSGNFTNISGGTHTITSGVFAAGSAASPSITFTGDLNTGIYSPGADQVAISTGGSGRLFVDANGCVGLGATPDNQAYRLQIYNASQDAAYLSIGNSVSGSGALNGLVVGQNQGDSLFINRENGSQQFYTNGSERLRITSAGLVGVGTSSPSYTIDVNGTARFNGNTVINGSSLDINPSSGQPNITLRSGNTFRGYIEGNSSGGLTFGSGPSATTAMTIDSSQRVGIGTSVPSSLLHLGAASGTVQMQFNNGGTSSYLGHDPSVPGFDIASKDATTFRNFNGALFVETMRITPAGRVGIGTTSPNTPLDVNGAITCRNGGAIRGYLGDVDANTNMQIRSESGVITFNNPSSERARIDSSGRLLVGTSSSASAGQLAPYSRLQVMGNTVSEFGILSLARNEAASGITAGETLGAIAFVDSAGNDYAWIQALADGTAGTNDYPGRLVFFTTADGASSPTERMRIDSAGRIGIGTTSPSSPINTGRLMVQGGDIVVRDDNVGNNWNRGTLVFDIRNSNGDSKSAYIQSNKVGDVSSTLQFFTTATHALSERMRIDDAGRLLVGTSTSISNVYVGGGAYQAPFQIIGNAAGYGNGLTQLNYSAGGYASTITLGTSKNATVGVNGAVSSGDDIGIINFAGNDGTNFRTGAYIIASIDGTTGTGDLPTRLAFWTAADGSASPTERMRIRSNGHMLLNTDSDLAFFSVVDSTYGASDIFVRTFGNGGASFIVRGDGDVENTNNSYGGLSDIKLKENIVDATSQWNDIKALQVRKYNFKEGQTHTQIGLVAQEVELVSPGLVSESPDRDAEGNDLGTVTKSVNYSVLYMKAVKALQEAMERIEQLEAEMAAIKAQFS